MILQSSLCELAVWTLLAFTLASSNETCVVTVHDRRPLLEPCIKPIAD